MTKVSSPPDLGQSPSFDEKLESALAAIPGWSDADSKWLPPARPTPARIPVNPYRVGARHHIRRFQNAFSNVQYHHFFHKLEHIAGRKLSVDERDAIVNACHRLIEQKKNAQTPEALDMEQKWESKEKKRLAAKAKKIGSLAENIWTSIISLEHAHTFKGNDRILKYSMRLKCYIAALHDPFDEYYSLAPMKAVLSRIVHASKDTIEECKAKSGWAADSELNSCILKLAPIWGKKITVSYKENGENEGGEAVSPFIDFARAILLALPDEALMGREGPIDSSAIGWRIHTMYKKRCFAGGVSSAGRRQSSKRKTAS